MTNIKENLEKTFHDTKSNLTKTIANRDIQDTIEKKAHQLGKQARQYYDTGSKKVEDQVAKLSDVIKEQPILSVSLAFVAGIALCKLVDLIKD